MLHVLAFSLELEVDPPYRSSPHAQVRKLRAETDQQIELLQVAAADGSKSVVEKGIALADAQRELADLRRYAIDAAWRRSHVGFCHTLPAHAYLAPSRSPFAASVLLPSNPPALTRRRTEKEARLQKEEAQQELRRLVESQKAAAAAQLEQLLAKQREDFENELNAVRREAEQRMRDEREMLQTERDELERKLEEEVMRAAEMKAAAEAAEAARSKAATARRKQVKEWGRVEG